MSRFLVVLLVLFTAVARAQDRKPVIGVEADLVRNAQTGALEEHVSETYLQAVRDAGGEPLVLSPLRMTPDQAIERVDAIVLTGGPDLPPELYGEKALTADKLVEPARLAFSKALVAEADARGMPLLGICLGNQLLNVLRGGKLVQDIPTTVKDAVTHRKNGDDHDSGEAHHPIEVVKGSQLSLATGEKLDVNSFHHQAVEKPGSGLKVVARAPDGVVEAVESADPGRFIMGVQWHPERMPAGSPGRRVFDKLVAAARGFRSALTEGVPLDVKKIRDEARAAGLAKDLALARERDARPARSEGLVAILDRAEEHDRSGER